MFRNILLTVLSLVLAALAQAPQRSLTQNDEQALFRFLDKQDAAGAKKFLDEKRAAGFDIDPAIGAVFGKGEEFYNSGDYRRAVMYYSIGADLGNPKCQGTLGYMYANGKGVLFSREKAVALWKLSANGGDAIGFANLGFATEGGWPGVEKSTEKAIELYRRAVATNPGSDEARFAEQRLTALGASTAFERAASSAFEWDQSVPLSLRSHSSFLLNGIEVHAEQLSDTSVTFLGQSPSLGLNLVASGKNAKDAFLLWREERRLIAFERPYKESVAIIVAIDDYARTKDPKRRGPTGFGQLGSMRAGAEQLKQSLLKLGFSPEKIITLYDEQAERESIEAALESLWQGGSRSTADQVFFYFGGHGTHVGNSGVLVTYDFNSVRPTLTSILMKDLTGRQAENIVAKHVLIALDACDSGLAIGSLGDDLKASELTKFRALSIIRNDTKQNARNVLLAGTGDQPVVYDNGGIFTRALVKGLRGDADLNKDGLIEASELGVYVQDEVAFAAGKNGVEQKAGFYKLSSYGAGEMVFLRAPE